MSDVASALRLALGYVPYWLRAKNRHGLQAPFAFSLYEEVMRHDQPAPEQAPIEALRRTLLKDKEHIEVRDFGAGFGGERYKKPEVAFITRNSAKPRRYARLLFRLARHLKPSLSLELGTSLGISSLYLAAGHPEGAVITIEGCPNTAAKAAAHFKQFPQYDIRPAQGLFREVLPAILKELTQTVDLLFLDGHHHYQATMDYFQLCLPYLSKDAVVIVDDIRWSDEMYRAWVELTKHRQVTLTMDLYVMGLLFLNPGLSKEQFTIRY